MGFVNRLGKRFFGGTRLGDALREYFRVPVRIRIVNFIFQRIFRINSGLPWSMHYTSIVQAPHRLKIGKGVKRYFAVSGHCYIQAFNGIEIGDGTIFAPGVKIISTNHEEGERRRSLSGPPIIIGKYCWLGANAVIWPGVTIGDHSIVAAGAVVTKSVPEGVIVGGIPARHIRKVRSASESVDKRTCRHWEDESQQ